jgi:hypothetical protein
VQAEIAKACRKAILSRLVQPVCADIEARDRLRHWRHQEVKKTKAAIGGFGLVNGRWCG